MPCSPGPSCRRIPPRPRQRCRGARRSPRSPRMVVPRADAARASRPPRQLPSRERWPAALCSRRQIREPRGRSAPWLGDRVRAGDPSSSSHSPQPQRRCRPSASTSNVGRALRAKKLRLAAFSVGHVRSWYAPSLRHGSAEYLVPRLQFGCVICRTCVQAGTLPQACFSRRRTSQTSLAEALDPRCGPRPRLTRGDLSPARLPHQGGEELSRVRTGRCRDLLRRPRCDNAASSGAALRSEIDDVIRRLDDIEVVLDHNHRVSSIDQAVKHTEELRDIVEMQPGGRLVEYVEGPSSGAFGQLRSQLHALSLTARKSRRRLTHLYVTETDVTQSVEMARNRGNRREEVRGLAHTHLEYLSDVFSLVADCQRLAVVALSLTNFARHIDVGEEMHLDLDRSFARAWFTATTANIEREPAGLVATATCVGRLREE